MNNVIKRIKIDLYSPTSYEIIKAQQGDNRSRLIEFSLYNQGNPYTIPNNILIKMEGHRGDNSFFPPKECIVSNNIITVTLDSDVLYEAGTVEAKIVMYDLSNDNILSTIPFKLYVQKHPCDKNKIENEKKSLIDWLILNFEKLKVSFDEHINNFLNPHKVTKSQVGLGNVDNTADINKPVSITQQYFLDKKANIESPTLTGIPKAPTASVNNNSTQIATTAFTQSVVSNHNTSASAHKDIRDLISALTTRLNTLADSDDTTLDQLSEIVAYIKSNRTLIENISELSAIVSNKVDGVKGNEENSYRSGYVNLTPANIGAAVSKEINGSDFNDVIIPGLYALFNARTNAPISNYYSYALIVMKSDPASVTQIAIPANKEDIYVRSYYFSKWGSWVKQLKSGDTVGNATKATQDGNGNVIADTYVKKSDWLNLAYPIGAIYMSVNNTNPSTLFGGTWVAWGNGRVPVGINTSETEFNTIEKTGGEKAHILTESEMPSHTHTVRAHAHSLNSHTHVIPALSGSAASAGEHTHSMTYDSKLLAAGNAENRVYANGTGKKTGSGGALLAGAHTHTITTTASTTGASTENTANSTPFDSGTQGSGIAHNNMPPYIVCYMWKRTA